MKKLLCAGAMLASLAAIQSASAADMALKAPPPPAPVYSWTGWYVGLNLGGSFGRAADTTTFGAGPTVFSSTSSRLDGVIGGGQIGYNWQANTNWLFGLEADIQGSSERGTATSSVGIAGLCGVIAVFPCTTARYPCGPGKAALVRHGPRTGRRPGKSHLAVLRHRRSRLWRNQEQRDPHRCWRPLRRRRLGQ